MNERIRELWAQAGGHYDSGNQHTWPQYTIDNPEKFAELIVKECAKLVEENMDPQNAWITPRYIKEHFGVEE
jgi:hypothetical protein